MSTQTISHSSAKDVVIAKLTILSDPCLYDTAINMVSHIANSLGVSSDDSHKLEKVLNEILETVVNDCYEGCNDQNINVIAARRFNSLVIAVEDKGIPFQFDSIEEGNDKRFQTYMALGYADRVYYKNLGPDGNRIEIRKFLPASDIRNSSEISDENKSPESEVIDTNERLDVRLLEFDDIKELVKVVYRSYGHSYPSEFMYYPERIEARIKSGLLISCVTSTTNGEIIGHLGLTFETQQSRVCESGIAIVDTRYRGQGVFKKMREFLQNYARENKIIGIYGEAVTIHPFTQKGVAKFGAKEVGFLFGYTPGEITVKDIEVKADSRRQSIALMYTTVLYNKKKSVFLPLIYHEVASRIYEQLEFKRDIETSNLPISESENNLGKSEIVMRKDYGQVFVIIEEYGRDTLVEINFVLRQMCTLRMDCIYVDLPIFDQHASQIISKLRESGFFIGGIIPELRNGDVLRMQYLNNVQIRKNDIKVASEFGKYVLDKVFEDKDDIELNSLKESL